MLIAGNYYTIKCVQYEWKDFFDVKLSTRKTCWLPEVFHFPKIPEKHELNLVSIQNVNNLRMRFQGVILTLWY